ncbi:putative MFS transporter [Aspergillus thermomutatus]|uniref:Major facilitator superfamily (MFS) profile domain-containing protein n=1 Tax=Aspergillus thermomutatus TaxID=41047 RepID=A0A397HGG6_ASPTH|nr:uncharacterized protein CDV56_106107 [Aspergillus thermomutatus]RHZ61138.1 hypothetical protein CDV56_106107 [Aspergillus thermomutatus]
MASRRALFTATRTQTLTYLLAVCPFSIAFLVFINSSVSFVVTELIGLHDGEGDAVGTLGFADELLALAACPLWGLLSDRIGVRNVCVIGYGIIAVALVAFVQASNVYPQLLLGRLFFSLGGSAVSTMVTAVLPAVTGGTSSEQLRLREESQAEAKSPSSRLAGFVGMCAGCGALISLAIFLPLPARFQSWGYSPSEAIQNSYYVVASVALLVSFCSLMGLRGLASEEGKEWRLLWTAPKTSVSETDRVELSQGVIQLPYLDQLSTALFLGLRNRDIFLGYLGGFVARASSVGISLFIPLFVNHYYRRSGLCGHDQGEVPETMPRDIKQTCRKAYILASILTGVSQLVALIAAPAFGYLSERSRRYHAPLMFASSAGILGYTMFALLPSPQFRGSDGSAGVFVLMGLIGISQIGAIVCSLAVLSNGILSISLDSDGSETFRREEGPVSAPNRSGQTPTSQGNQDLDEHQPLLDGSTRQRGHQLSDLKGSIAGVYSLYGGAGILFLTKLGGLLFDNLSPAAPFYIMAGFNAVLLLAGIATGAMSYPKKSASRAGA